jgi:hypothetical protein
MQFCLRHSVLLLLLLLLLPPCVQPWANHTAHRP